MISELLLIRRSRSASIQSASEGCARDLMPLKGADAVKQGRDTCDHRVTQVLTMDGA